MGSLARAKSPLSWWWVAVPLVAVLVVTGCVVFSRSDVDASAAVDCSVPERETADDAGSVAAACGVEIEVTSERTPWVSVYAQPDGLSRMQISAVPEFTDANGGWEPLDPSVSPDPIPATVVETPTVPGPVVSEAPAGAGAPVDGSSAEPGQLPHVTGMLTVEAPLFPMWFNPGGASGADRPLGVIERDGSWVALWFPLALPAPIVDGRFVTYPLAEGVELLVAISADGAAFRPIITLADASAAVWFENALAEARGVAGLPGSGVEVPYKVTTSPDVSVRAVDEVGVEFVAQDGQVLFWSPPSIMWDSAADAKDTGAEAPLSGDDRREFPLPGDRSLQMPVRVDDSTGDAVIVVAPDEGMLSDSSTVWPVRIDPTLGNRTPVEWIAVRTGGFTSPLYKWTDTATRKGESMGRCNLSWSSGCVTNFTSRLVWEFGGLSLMKQVVGADITSATFSADPGGRGSCASTTTDAYSTDQITSTVQSWNAMGFYVKQASVTAPQGDACSDGGVRREWSVKAAVVAAANANTETVAIGLKASNEVSSDGYKTYQSNALLSIVYNRAPSTPTSLKLSSPAKNCVSGVSRPVIATTTPTISAVMKDPDGGTVIPRFQVLAQGTSTVVWDSGKLAGKASGSTFTAAVPAGVLASDTSYSYRAIAYDAARNSAWTASCEFTVDVTKPTAPEISPVHEGVAAVYESGVERGGVGLQGKFLLSRGASTDLSSFQYSFNSTTLGSTATPDASGTAVISYTPTATGPVVLRVTGKDAAGNVSQVATYEFDVASAKEDAVWMFDEGAGDTAADSSGVGSPQNFVFDGPTWDIGPHQLFASRQGDGSLLFNGETDEATTAPIIDTTHSFVVSTYVWLHAEKLGAGPYTAVSQDGASESGFGLSYLPICAGMTDGCWAFRMKDADTTAATTTTVTSTVPVTGDGWVHLVGAHDASAQTMKLWVCEIGTPNAPGNGDPISTSVPRGATPWPATGGFTVGRGLTGATGGEWWPGRVDNVRVFSGQIVSEAKIRRLCHGAETTDFSTGLDALDPTTTNGE